MTPYEIARNLKLAYGENASNMALEVVRIVIEQRDVDRPMYRPKLHPLAKTVLAEVCAYFCVDEGDVLGDRRIKRAVAPRHMYWALLRDRLQIPYTEIAWHSNRDHSTIMQMAKAVDQTSKAWLELNRRLDSRERGEAAE